jgi:hypothetical protein
MACTGTGFYARHWAAAFEGKSNQNGKPNAVLLRPAYLAKDDPFFARQGDVGELVLSKVTKMIASKAETMK